jgi:PadR family transcriptional regulator, regulatory protein AphA
MTEHSINGAEQPLRRSDGLSDLEVALLGLLSVRPMSGYEIGRHFDRALAPWWDAPRTQIYPKLRELEGRGLVEHEYVVQHSKPNKRVYTLTPTGLERLREWLRDGVRWVEMRHHMMMRLFLGNVLPAEELRRLLSDYRDRTAAWAGELRQIETKFKPSLSGPYGRTVLFELLSLRHLIAMAELEITGATEALSALDQADDDPLAGHADRAGHLLDAVRERFS